MFIFLTFLSFLIFLFLRLCYVVCILTLHYVHYSLRGFAILVVNESEVIDLFQFQYRHIRVPVENLLHLLLRHIEREVPYEQSRHLFVIAYDIELVQHILFHAIP